MAPANSARSFGRVVRTNTKHTRSSRAWRLSYSGPLTITNIFNKVSPVAPNLLDKSPRNAPFNSRKAGSREVANIRTLPHISRPLWKAGKVRASHLTHRTAPGFLQTTLAILGGISPAKVVQKLPSPAVLTSTADVPLAFFVKIMHCHKPLVVWSSSELNSSNASKKTMTIYRTIARVVLDISPQFGE